MGGDCDVEKEVRWKCVCTPFISGVAHFKSPQFAWADGDWSELVHQLGKSVKLVKIKPNQDAP